MCSRRDLHILGVKFGKLPSRIYFLIFLAVTQPKHLWNFVPKLEPGGLAGWDVGPLGVARLSLSLLYCMTYSFYVINNLSTIVFFLSVLWMSYINNIRFAVLFSALPTPHAILAINLDQELFHPLSNCKSQRLSF